MGEGGAQLGRYVLGKIRDGFQFLAANPGAGHSRDDLTDEPVKFGPVFSYLIVYDPAMKPLGIARVLHGSQGLDTMFGFDHPAPERKCRLPPPPRHLVRRRDDGVGVDPVQPEQVDNVRALAETFHAEGVDGVAPHAA